MKFRYPLKYLESDPFLTIGTTAEDGSDKYEVLQHDAGKFGNIKIFLTSCRMDMDENYVTVHIIDDGLENEGN
jgi:hypothetical protein